MYTRGEHNEEIEAMVQQRKSHFIASRLLAQEFFPGCRVYKDKFGKPHLHNHEAAISWSHSGDYAALIADEHEATGIDIEKLDDRILRIEDKFCNAADKDLIISSKRAECLLMIWTAKESLYKWYGRKEVDFRKHMTVEPFELATEGRYYARFHNGEVSARFLLEYSMFKDHIASWIMGEEKAASATL